MQTTQGNTLVGGREEVEKMQQKRTGRAFIFFKTEWWETVSTRHIGNDIYIKTNRDIRAVYLNGELLTSSSK